MTKASRRPKENCHPRPAIGTFSAFVHHPAAVACAAAVAHAAARARARGHARAAAATTAAAHPADPIHLASPIRPASPVATAEDEDEPWHSLSDSDDVRQHWSDPLPEDFPRQPLVQYVLAMPTVCDIPVAQLPDMTQPQLSYINASLVHEWGELASPQCNYCSVALLENPGRKVTYFLACVVLDGWSNGGCTNCHWHNTNPCCSLRNKYNQFLVQKRALTTE